MAKSKKQSSILRSGGGDFARQASGQDTSRLPKAQLRSLSPIQSDHDSSSQASLPRPKLMVTLHRSQVELGFPLSPDTNPVPQLPVQTKALPLMFLGQAIRRVLCELGLCQALLHLLQSLLGLPPALLRTGLSNHMSRILHQVFLSPLVLFTSLSLHQLLRVNLWLPMWITLMIYGNSV
jgi:hypothetical protein